MKSRSIRPDPKTRPDEDEYVVIDTEQDGPSRGREYVAGHICRLGKRDYLGIPTRPAQALNPGQQTPLQTSDRFSDVESAANSFRRHMCPLSLEVD